MFKDYYEVLGVPPSATAEQIRTSYRQLALQSHPDKHVNTASTSTGSHAEAAGWSTSQNTPVVEFTEIQEAYEVLSDVARRYLYDLNYAELVAVRNQLAAQAEQRRLYELQLMKEQQQREREQAARELQEREKAKALAAARAATTTAAELPGLKRCDVPDAFSMSRTMHSGTTFNESTATLNATLGHEDGPLKKKKRNQPPRDAALPPPHPPALPQRHTAATAAEPEKLVQSSSPTAAEPHAADATGPLCPSDAPAKPTKRSTGARGQRSASSYAGTSTTSRVVKECSPSTSAGSAEFSRSAPASVKLPSLATHRTLSMSFDDTADRRGGRQTNRSRNIHDRSGALSEDSLRSRDDEYLRRRAVERTLHVFFAQYGFGNATERPLN